MDGLIPDPLVKDMIRTLIFEDDGGLRRVWYGCRPQGKKETEARKKLRQNVVSNLTREQEKGMDLAHSAFNRGG